MLRFLLPNKLHLPQTISSRLVVGSALAVLALGLASCGNAAASPNHPTGPSHNTLASVKTAYAQYETPVHTAFQNLVATGHKSTNLASPMVLAAIKEMATALTKFDNEITNLAKSAPRNIAKNMRTEAADNSVLVTEMNALANDTNPASVNAKMLVYDKNAHAATQVAMTVRQELGLPVCAYQLACG